MKINEKIAMRLAGSLMAAVMVFAACGPDVKPPVEGEGNVDSGNRHVEDSLRNALYGQARAMQVMLTQEEVLVSGYSRAELEGVYDVTLSEGVSFRFFADEEGLYAKALSYVDDEDGMCWAVTGKDGVTQAVNAGGKSFPLSAEMDVKILDGKYHLVLEDSEIALDYDMEDKVQAFGCRPLEDNSGEIYAFRFVFGDEKSKTLYVDGYDAVYFHMDKDAEKKPLDEIYLGADNKVVIGVNLPFEAEVRFNCPEGWNVQLNEGRTSVEVTAAGGDVTEAALELVSAEDGHVFASVVLTNDMFTSFFASASSVSAAPTAGLGKFAYGISLYGSFSADGILAMAAKLLSGEESPAAGSGVSETAFCYTFEQVLGSGLDPEQSYVFWCVADGKIVNVDFGEISADMEVTGTHLLDVDVSLSVKGAGALFGGVVEKTEGFAAEILSQINSFACDSVVVEGKSYKYEGPATGFSTVQGGGCAMRPETTYVLWVVPAVTGDYEYTEADMYTFEMKTNAILPGGSLSLAHSENAEVTASTISWQLLCEGAAMIMYAWFDDEVGLYVDSQSNEQKYAMIVGENDYRIGEYVQTYDDEVAASGRRFSDNTEYWLYAVPVDADGKYGDVLCLSAKTEKLVHDETIQLTVEPQDITSSSVTFKITSTGDLSDYIYWIGLEEDAFWRTKCNQKKTVADEYMALNPDDEDIQAAMRKYGKIASDGTFTVTGLAMDTKYIFLLMEKGDEHYSHVVYKPATTLAADLGDIVLKDTEKWLRAKEQTVINWHEERFEQGANNMFSYYAFDITCPTDLTAYILCASDEYFAAAKIERLEHQMIHIEECTSELVEKGSMVKTASGELKNEPSYIKNGKEETGYLMDVVTYYPHGAAFEGAVTYFAAGTHGEAHCTCWENGACSAYEYSCGRIAYYKTLEPWLTRAKKVYGLTGSEAEACAAGLLDAYAEFYKDAEPCLYVNEGKPLEVVNAYAMGVDAKEAVPDRVIVMYKDLQNNYYEPIYIEVPNYFKKSE